MRFVLILAVLILGGCTTALNPQQSLGLMDLEVEVGTFDAAKEKPYIKSVTLRDGKTRGVEEIRVTFDEQGRPTVTMKAQGIDAYGAAEVRAAAEKVFAEQGTEAAKGAAEALLKALRP